MTKKKVENPNCRAFKTRIYPTKNQIRYFNKCFGLRRWYWNWALDRYITEYKATKKKLTAYQLGTLINKEVLNKPEYQWAKQCSNTVREFVFRDLNEAWDKYYDELDKAKQTTKKIDFEKNKPQFKSKKKSTNSFSTRSGSHSDPKNNINGKYYKLPMYGSTRPKPMSIKTAENLDWLKKDDYKICYVTIKEEYSQYYISITYERTNHSVIKPDENTKIGIDMGMKTPLTCWDGTKEYKLNPLDRIKKAEKHREKCVRVFNKKLDSYRLQTGRKTYQGIKYRESNRYKKARTRMQRAYQREEHIKQDFREQVTTWLVKNYHTINIEPFTNKFKHSRRAVSRISQYAFYERLKQKAEEYGTVINWISWEPTTQTCNVCQHVFKGDDKLTMNDRIYKCPVCGNVEDRDVNAAKNIYNIELKEM